MKHRKKNRRFNRSDKVRTGFLRSLLTSFIENEKIITTEARAKEIRPIIEKLLTKAIKDDLSTQRLISSRLGNKPKLSKKLIKEIAPRFKERSGGYTRITKLPPRKGDASPMSIIEFV